MNISAKTWKWLLICSGLALLLMMLAYPFGYDQTVFMVGGEMTVKHGAVPYRDFLDTKPPLIFLIYGFSSLIFGHHEWSIRAFDILFHIVSLLYFFKLLKRITGDENLALSSVILYILFYVTSGYWMTAQAETFALLPSLIAFDMTDRIRNPQPGMQSHTFVLGIYAGLACGILFLLKFTLLAVAIGIFIYFLLYSKQFPKKYFAGLLMGLIGIIGSYALFLIASGAMNRFLEALSWVKQYADIDPLFSMQTIVERYFKQFPMLAIYPFGLSGILLAVLGILWYFKDRLKPVFSEEKKKGSSFVHLFLQLALGLLAVLYERKFFPYHFARIYWAFVPFVAIGLRELRNIWKNYSLSWTRLNIQDRLLRNTIVVTIFAVLFFFSTAPRIISQPLHFLYMQMNGADVAQDVQDQMPQYNYKEEQQIADRLRPLMKPDDKIFVWGNSIGIYYFLGKYPTTIVLTNTPLVTQFTPPAWKDSVINELKSSPPRFFIVEFGDEREYISGSHLDSWQHLLAWKELYEFITSNYSQQKGLGHFMIFEKNSRN